MYKILFITTLILILHNISIGQQVNDSIFQLFKKKVESSDFPPYAGKNFKFNRTNFIVRLNSQKDSLIIERIKIPEKKYSDPTQDKEVRSVAFKDIDFTNVNIRKYEGYYFFEIKTIDMQNHVKYKLIKDNEINFVFNNEVSIGRFYEPTTTDDDMEEMLSLFKSIYN